MSARSTLPENYREIFSVDLQKNTKTAVWIQVLSLAIAAAMAVPMHFVVPITTLFDMQDGLGFYLLRFAVFLALMVAYLFLHEMVHGIAMKHFGTKKVKFGFTGLYAFAGSDDYYDKRSYRVIALAPIVVWGVVLAVVNALVPDTWFWVIYWTQIANISGAAGDLYVTVKFSRLPADILVQDSGVRMTVYSVQ